MPLRSAESVALSRGVAIGGGMGRKADGDKTVQAWDDATAGGSQPRCEPETMISEAKDSQHFSQQDFFFCF